jgi:chorismate dehydratase
VYDLSKGWFEWQQLPFVFATWVSNKKLAKDFVDHFEQVLEYGINHIEEAVDHFSFPFPRAVQLDYLKGFIHYRFKPHYYQSLQLFISLI